MSYSSQWYQNMIIFRLVRVNHFRKMTEMVLNNLETPKKEDIVKKYFVLCKNVR